MTSDNAQKPRTGEVSLKELVLMAGDIGRFLRSKLPTILVACLIGALIGLAYSYFNKPLYTATTTFVLENGDAGGGLGQYAGLASMVGIDIGGGGGGNLFQGDNIIELYKSRTMIQKTLLTGASYQGKSKPLIEWYIDFNDLRSKWAKKPALRDIHFNKDLATNKYHFSRLQDSVIGTIVTDINEKLLSVAKPDKKLSIIRVDVKSKNEFFSKEFNDLIVRNVNDFYVQTKTKKAIQNVVILKNKADSVRNIMTGSIHRVAAVADATPNLNPSRQAQRVVPMQLSQFSAETNRAILSELVKNLELSKMSLLQQTPLIQVVDSPVYPLETERFGKAKGLIYGAILFGFLSLIFLVAKKIFKDILS